MMGSGGGIELAPPLTDDERRDFEIHVRGQYGFGLAIQVKSTRELEPYRGGVGKLHCQFPVRATRVVNSPLYWYFIAYLDLKAMRLADPVFLIPSGFSTAPQVPGAVVPLSISITANMTARSRDKWQPYQVGTLELGKRMLEIMTDLKKHRDKSLALAPIPAAPDVLWLRRAA